MLYESGLRDIDTVGQLTVHQIVTVAVLHNDLTLYDNFINEIDTSIFHHNRKA